MSLYYYLIQPTDTGYRLDVNGTFRTQSTVTLGGSAPTTSAGTYDILTRNSTTGVVEKVARTTFATTDSPSLTGTPTAPTATAGTNTTQIATTANVVSTINSRISGTTNYLPKFTGANSLENSI